MAVTQYTWNPLTDTVIEETNGAGIIVATYTNKPQPFGPLVSQNRGGTTRHFHFDAIGSTRLVSDDSQNITDTYTYDAWGISVMSAGTTTTPYRWVGRWGYQYDEVDHRVYVRARQYRSYEARWMSADPMLFADGLNLRQYAGNNPIRFIDASGKLKSQELSVKPNENAQFGTCGSLAMTWAITPARTLADGTKRSSVTIVQRHCISGLSAPISFTDCCEVDKLPCIYNCCFYEYLRTVDTTQVPAESSNDSWEERGGFLTFGLRRASSVIRGFDDPQLKIREKILESWTPPGELVCSEQCQVSYSVGFHTDKAPAFWDSFSDWGYNYATESWWCCPDQKSSASAGSNTVPSVTLFYNKQF